MPAFQFKISKIGVKIGMRMCKQCSVIRKKTEGIASTAYPTAQIVHMSTSVDWLTFNSLVEDLELQNLESGNIHHN